MPDLQKRNEFEQQAERSIDSVFRAYRKGKTFVPAVFEEELQANLTRTLEDIHREAAIVLLLLWMQSDSIPMRSLARFDRLPREQARQTARSVTRTTEKIIATAEQEAAAIARGITRADVVPPSQTSAVLPSAGTVNTIDPAQSARLRREVDREIAARLREANRRAFGRQRAEDISITETTTASSRAESAAKEIVAETGNEIQGTWVTENDDRVCPVCAPLHDQPESVWRPRFPNGPSAHVRCRCWLRWELVSTAG